MKAALAVLITVCAAACAGPLIAPEQQRAIQAQNYCNLQATAARDALGAQQDQGTQPIGGFTGGYMQGAALATAYQAAYERCMLELRQK